MLGTDPVTRKDGEKILNNYKKQLAETLAREAVEDPLFRPLTGSSSGKRKTAMSMGKTKSSMNSRASKSREGEQ